MAEQKSTTETVTTSSSGTVKIAIEEYNDLVARANQPKTVTYNQILKTDAMRSADNKMYGAIMMGGGLATFLIGAIQFSVGVKQSKAL